MTYNPAEDPWFNPQWPTTPPRALRDWDGGHCPIHGAQDVRTCRRCPTLGAQVAMAKRVLRRHETNVADGWSSTVAPVEVLLAGALLALVDAHAGAS